MQIKQNITVKLGKSLIRKAKVLAAQRGTSVSQLLSQMIEQMVAAGDHYSAAHQKALAFLEKGFHMGGKIRATRDELHER